MDYLQVYLNNMQIFWATSGVLGFLLCLFTLDIVGLVVYVASLVFWLFMMSKIEFNRQTFELVEKMVKKKYEHQDVDTKTVARQMYKTLKSEIKPGRSYIDFCEITALILERYSQGAETLNP